MRTLKEYFCSKEALKYSFFLRALRNWNSLPKVIVNVYNVEVFMKPVGVHEW